MKKGYIPKDQRKKILLMCDDIRTHSGVATVAKEIVIHTCHHFNWLQIGAAVQHPEAGKKLDISTDTQNIAGINDASVMIYPSSGYGNPTMVRQIIQEEKPDAILIFTDPRYWTWLFQIENEIRRNIPIAYLNIWDDYPAPRYNEAFYESCDLLMGISKQTVNINKLVLGDKIKDKIISYVPHGLNHKIFKPREKTDTKVQAFKKSLYGDKDIEFAVLFNSRNIRRKQVPDTIWAYKQFIDKLNIEQAKKCALVLHTQKVDPNGTDLEKVVEMLCGGDEKYNIIFTPRKYTTEEMALLYNSTDAQILLTSNEGWGLSLTEALLSGNPIIANVTGGMQDQMRFENEKGEWFTPTPDLPSNHTKKLTKCGEWAFPVFPVSRSIQGSPPTPYIFDDRCDPSDAADQLYKLWEMGDKIRKEKGKAGREWAISSEAGLTSEIQGERVIENFNLLFDTWVPQIHQHVIKVTPLKKKVTQHKLIY